MSVTTYSFTLYGEPVPKGRSRITYRKGKPHSYTPSKTAQAEDDYKVQILNKINTDRDPTLPLFSSSVPVRMQLIFYRARPKTAPKRVILPATRPDLDNTTKTILDAAEGILFHDDAQITTLSISKRFGAPPRTICIITEDTLT